MKTQNVFEELKNYLKPPLIDISAINIRTYLEQLSISKSQKYLLSLYLKLSRYDKNLKTFYKSLEEILRTHDKKSGALFAPVVSASIALKDDKVNTDPFKRAAALIISAKSFYSDLYSGVLEPDKYNNHLLEMGQYPNCFSTCQLIEGNSVKLYRGDIIDFVTIIVNGIFYSLNIKNIKSNSINELADVLKEISKNSELNITDEYNSPGIITCGRNKTQIKIFRELLKNKTNKLSYNIIKDSFFIVCLDIDKKPTNMVELLRLAHIGNPKNRWYHSSLQIVVTGNAKAACVCNFSNSISGNIMMRLSNELFFRSQNVKEDYEDNKSNLELDFNELKWEVDKKQIKIIKSELEPIIDDQISTFTINGFNNKLLTSKNLKAVPLFIIALQKTIHDILNIKPQITQFVSMSKYRCMDLTLQNISTKEVLKYIDLWDNQNISYEEKYNHLLKAIESQQKKIRFARKSFPIFQLLQMNLKSFKGFQFIYRYLLFSLLVNYFVLTGYFKKNQSEVLVSHPKIFEGIECIGRPGIKIPYVKYFGLHYQIFEKNIIVTMMPGVSWKIPNVDFFNQLEKNINELNNFLKVE